MECWLRGWGENPCAGIWMCSSLCVPCRWRGRWGWRSEVMGDGPNGRGRWIGWIHSGVRRVTGGLMAGSRGTEEMGIFCSHHVLRRIMLSVRRDGLVGYDAALTQLRSGVRFPLFVFCFWTSCISLAFAVYNHELEEAIIMRNEAELPITYTRVLYVIYSRV